MRQSHNLQRKSFLWMLILGTLFGSGLCAQGTLQFNQVVSHSGMLTGSWSYTSPTYTVPAGKVWKIEAASAAISSAVSRNLEVDAGGGFGLLDLGSASMPVWLKAGDQVRISGSRNCCSTSNFYYLISILEFNIIP